MSRALQQFTHTLDRYQAERSAVFPSLTALRWFMAVHRQDLLESRAVIRPIKQYLVDPDAFDAVVEQVGDSRARQAAA